MASLTEYFQENRPKPKYHIGDRVHGKYHGIPFCGTVGGETTVNFTVGAVVTVFLDLPLKYKKEWIMTFINVKPSTLEKLK